MTFLDKKNLALGMLVLATSGFTFMRVHAQEPAVPEVPAVPTVPAAPAAVPAVPAVPTVPAAVPTVPAAVPAVPALPAVPVVPAASTAVPAAPAAASVATPATPPPPPAVAPAASAPPDAAPAALPPVEASAGTVPAPAAPDDDKTELSLQQILETGGWLLWVLAVMSVVGVAFVVYFLIVLTRRNITPPDFVKDVQMMLSYNRIIEAKKACAKSRSPSAVIAMAGIDYIEKVDDPDPSMLKEILEGEGGRQASLMQNQITYLLDIGVIAPMVGLLGTVFGMVRTFNVVALDIAKAKPIELAAGVSQALITTAGGLLVGIPAMLAYAYFRGRTAKLISGMEVVATEFLTALVNRKK